jgi:hypothetical protein
VPQPDATPTATPSKHRLTARYISFVCCSCYILTRCFTVLPGRRTSRSRSRPILRLLKIGSPSRRLSRSRRSRLQRRTLRTSCLSAVLTTTTWSRQRRKPRASPVNVEHRYAVSCLYLTLLTPLTAHRCLRDRCRTFSFARDRSATKRPNASHAGRKGKASRPFSGICVETRSRDSKPRYAARIRECPGPERQGARAQGCRSAGSCPRSRRLVYAQANGCHTASGSGIALSSALGREAVLRQAGPAKLGAPYLQQARRLHHRPCRHPRKSVGLQETHPSHHPGGHHRGCPGRLTHGCIVSRGLQMGQSSWPVP